MPKFRLMLSAALCTFAAPAFAQTAPAPQAAKTDGQSGAQIDEGNAGDIIVTATRRSEALSDVPLAVSAVTATSLQNSGASDIRALNQLSPSLLVSSTSSEAAGGSARIRGIGTVGDNAGLESSVATFIDGVYRNRPGVGLTELGAIDRIEVLRGPQGTLFGRNASAGLISVITAKPSFTFGGQAEASYGNYDAIRLVGGLTGPISEQLAFRVDGVYFKRDGFITDVTSGRGLNNRDRYLVRGQLLFQPSDTFSVRLIGDYSKRKEECCAAVVYSSAQILRNPDGTISRNPNPVFAAFQSLGANYQSPPFARRTAITAGQGYQSDVEDMGVSAEINATFGSANLTSITAYRDWYVLRGQDADFTALDAFRRLGGGGYDQGFKTFSQELRLQGEAFGGKLDWLVGGYYANETLRLRDNLSYGPDFEKFANCSLASSLSVGLNVPSLVSGTGTGCFNGAVAAAVSANLLVPAQTRGLLRLVSGLAIPGLGGFSAIAAAPASSGGLGNAALGAALRTTAQNDQYQQKSRNFAVFTHNVIKFTDAFNLTIGLRYTNERKTLDATLSDNNAYCRAIRTSGLASLSGIPCAINALPGGAFTQTGQVKSEEKLTGTAVLSFKPTDGLLTYASFSRGYKAGGFNLDRASLLPATPNLSQLQFDPEVVDAYEIGLKLNRRGFDLNIALFKQDFKGFQLNAFNGLNFAVTNLNGCSADLGGRDTDNSDAAFACPGKIKPGVISKGVEIEAFMRPARNVSVNLGLTYTDTSYQKNLLNGALSAVGAGQFQLPGSRLSNSSEYVVTGAATWTPPLGDNGLSGLLYGDFRYMSAITTGSDLDIEKVQPGFIVVNARVGIRGAEQRWGLEFWVQNLLDTDFQQTAVDSPLQPAGGGTTRGVQRGFYPFSNQIYSAFLGEPRTYGVTARFKF